MVRYQAKEELKKFLSTIDKANEDNEDLIEALEFALADMETLQDVISAVHGVCDM